MQKKILIADDHLDAADTTGALLRTDARFVVEVVYGGLQAVEKARMFAPDLVILDINMPGIDGYETARVLRAQQPSDRKLVLVALTGRSTQEDVNQARLAGFDYHLAKPAAPHTLCAVIASFLEPPRDTS